MTAATPHMKALAYLQDNIRDLPTWLQRLTPLQMEQLAVVLCGWEADTDSAGKVLAFEEVERREVTHALIVFNGDVCAAAKALGIGKTTLYRKIKTWGFTPSNRRLLCESAGLGSGIRISSDRRRTSAEV